MDFAVPDEYEQLRQSLLRFIRTEVTPLEETLRVDADVAPPPLRERVRRRSAELGFYAADYPEDVGGSGLPQLGMVLLREAAAGTGLRLAMDVFHQAEGPTPLLLEATDEQRKRYLAPLVRAEMSKCFALTEPDAGSDALAIRTTAVRDGDGWVLNGDKTFISDAGRADVAIVFAVTEEADGVTAFIVDRRTPGFEVSAARSGMLDDPIFDLTLRDCRVPATRVIGGPAAVGLAFYLNLRHLARPRLSIAATCNGIADFALRLTTEYAKRRMAFGEPIGRFQQVQSLIVDSAIELRASRLMTYECAWKHDLGEAPVEEACAVKLYASEMVSRVLDRMIQVHGGAGWTRDLPLERLYRFTRMYRIVDGTTEIQRWTIARTMGLE